MEVKSIPGSQYTHEQRMEVISIFALTGSLVRAASQTGIPQSTLYSWRQQAWFAEHVGAVRKEKEMELDGAFTRIIVKALDAVEDRLDNGDPCIVDGRVQRVPVKAKDAALIAAIAFDKRKMLREPTLLAQESMAPDYLERLSTRITVLSGKSTATLPV